MSQQEAEIQKSESGAIGIGDNADLCMLTGLLLGTCTFTEAVFQPVFAGGFSEVELVDAVLALSLSISCVGADRVYNSSV